MTSAEDIKRWNAVADAYAQVTGQPEDSFFRRAVPAFASAVGDPTHKRILDIGCGHGWLGTRYARLGAQVVGIDGSSVLVDMARRAAPDISWLVHDLDTGLPDGIGTFDAAIAHMVLMDLPNLQPLLGDLRRVLNPGGAFVASILHPAFFNQDPTEDSNGVRYRKVAGYLTEERWRIDTFGGHWHYHRPLETYVRELVTAGFVVTDLTEPRTLPHKLADEADWNDYERWFAEIPTMLTIEARPA